jgi:hypothetical protein
VALGRRRLSGENAKVEAPKRTTFSIFSPDLMQRFSHFTAFTSFAINASLSSPELFNGLHEPPHALAHRSISDTVQYSN